MAATSSYRYVTRAPARARAPRGVSASDDDDAVVHEPSVIVITGERFWTFD